MKLAILADLHVSSPDAPDGEENHAQGLDLLERTVAEVSRLGCDHAVICGDLVNMGYDAEYADAKRLLTPLAGRLDVIPGNHEVVRAGLEAFASHFGPVPREAMLGGVRSVLLNTAVEGLDGRYWMGHLDDDSREMLHKAASHDGPLFVFAHHPFTGTIRPAPYPMMSQILDDRERLTLLSRPHPTVVWTGHTHRADLRREGGCTFVGLPAVCFWPHAFLVAEFDGPLMRVTTHRIITDTASSPDPKVRDGERGRTGPRYVADCEPPVEAFTLRLV